LVRCQVVSNNKVLKIGTKSAVVQDPGVLVIIPRSMPTPKGKIVKAIVEPAASKM